MRRACALLSRVPGGIRLFRRSARKRTCAGSRRKVVFYSGFLNEAHRPSRGSVDCMNVARLDQIRVAEGEKESSTIFKGTPSRAPAPRYLRKPARPLRSESARSPTPTKKWGAPSPASSLSLTGDRSSPVLKTVRYCCSSLVTICCVLLAWARALMPVWVRISYFDIFEVAAA